MNVRACDTCKKSINGQPRNDAFSDACTSMASYFPSYVDGITRLVLPVGTDIRKLLNSTRRAVENKGVFALLPGIKDERRSAAEKVVLLPVHPGSQIFVAKR